MWTTAFLLDRGLTNYWGYNSIGFFAPESSYSSKGVQGGQVTDFKEMVRELHRAGLEVIIDVVYNHTAEGNHLGPTYLVQRCRQRGLLPSGGERSTLLHGLHGMRQHAEHAEPQGACSSSWIAFAIG